MALNSHNVININLNREVHTHPHPPMHTYSVCVSAIVISWELQRFYQNRR